MENAEVVVNYGLLALLPTLLAIGLALKTKNIIVSLFTSVFVGVTIINGWNPALGFTSMVKDYMFGSLKESMNTQALFMMVIIGGFVALLTQSGGAMAFTDMVTRHVDSRKKCETGMWLGGLAVWFTDNGNSLIVGPIFEALGERLRVSREKFSYILDCTTSPICSMVPIIGWGVYAMSLIETELVDAGITNVTSWEVFTEGIPLNFYAVLTLGMAGFMAFTQWDFGPMLKAQNRAFSTGKTIRDGGTPMRSEVKRIELPEGVDPKISTMVIPLIVLLTVMFTYLSMKGLWYTKVAGTDIRTAIASGFLLGTIVLIFLCIKRNIFSFEKCLSIITGGMANMMFMCVVLVLAWSLSGVTKAMDTAGYLMRISEGMLNPALLPAIVFIIGAVMSLATGTSWGTMAILIPISLPMAINFGVSLPLIASAVISGGLYGDHVSPISDTTILASIGSASDHIDHFETQMPYATLVAVICAVMFGIAGWYSSSILIFVGAAILIGAIFILHKISVKKYGQEEIVN
ncbi:Na+/H+ antiporter NhaC family protein [Wukongibacter sp. M2B1]|uniref:Na+/H+ antiporter NhaC family protein n=1 Tax=Wukongibacter sp. M2B1 TaxID=3088895 RepID=UPI003D7BBC52